jgi:hypothetical protein
VLRFQVPPTSAVLEHDEVLDPGLLALDRHAEPGKARADDRDAVVLGGVLFEGRAHHASLTTRAPRAGIWVMW